MAARSELGLTAGAATAAAAAAPPTQKWGMCNGKQNFCRCRERSLSFKVFAGLSIPLDSWLLLFSRLHSRTCNSRDAACFSEDKLISTSIYCFCLLFWGLCYVVVLLSLYNSYFSIDPHLLTHQEEESAVLHAWVHTLNLWGSLLVLYSYIALASSVYMQQRL